MSKKPQIKKRWDSRSARLNIERRRKAKLGIDWRTRVHGTPKQIGSKFPIEAGTRQALPKLQVKTYRGISKRALEEAERMTAAGLSGYTAVLKYKDGSVETVPIVAKSYESFLEKLRVRLKDVDPKDVKEISICGGGKFFDTLKSAFHKAGTAAKGFVSGLAKGEQEGAPVPAPLSYRLGTALRKAPGQITRGIEAGAQKLGEIERIPRRIKGAYERGLRPHEAEMKELRKKIEAARAERQLEKLKRPFEYDAAENARRIDMLLENMQAEYEIAKETRNREEQNRAQREIWELRRLKERALREGPSVQRTIAMRIASMGGKVPARRHRVSFMAGGKAVKFWIQEAIKRKGSLRAYVQRTYGPEGFTAGKGRRRIIKMSVLKELAKKSGSIGFKARLATRLKSFRRRGGKMHDRPIRKYERVRQHTEKYGGMELPRHSFTTEPMDAAHINGYRQISKWSSRARK